MKKRRCRLGPRGYRSKPPEVARVLREAPSHAVMDARLAAMQSGGQTLYDHPTANLLLELRRTLERH